MFKLFALTANFFREEDRNSRVCVCSSAAAVPRMSRILFAPRRRMYVCVYVRVCVCALREIGNKTVQMYPRHLENGPGCDREDTLGEDSFVRSFVRSFIHSFTRSLSLSHPPFLSLSVSLEKRSFDFAVCVFIGRR